MSANQAKPTSTTPSGGHSIQPLAPHQTTRAPGTHHSRGPERKSTTKPPKNSPIAAADKALRAAGEPITDRIKKGQSALKDIEDLVDDVGRGDVLGAIGAGFAAAEHGAETILNERSSGPRGWKRGGRWPGRGYVTPEFTDRLPSATMPLSPTATRVLKRSLDVPWLPPAKRLRVSNSTTQAVETNPGPPRRNPPRPSRPAGEAKRRNRVKLKGFQPGPLKRRARKTANIISAQLGATRSPHLGRRAMTIRAAGKDTIEISGHDYVASPNFPVTTPKGGDRMVMFDVHPDLLLASSRLSKLAECFEFFLFKQFDVIGVTNAPTSTSGNYIVCFDMDPGDKILPLTGGGSAAKEYAIAHNGEIKKAFENFDCHMPKHHQQKEYFIQDGTTDLRLTRQARFYIIMGTTPSAAFDIDLWVRWRVVMRVAQIDGPSEAGPTSLAHFDVSTALTAANPFGSLAPSTTLNRWSGLGLGYNGTDSYIYLRQGSVSPTGFVANLNFIGATATTLTIATSPNLTALTGFSARSGGSGTATYLNSVGYSYSGGFAATVSLTAASYWNGSAWVAEPELTKIPVAWYMYCHLATYTTGTGAELIIIPVSSELGRKQRRLQVAFPDSIPAPRPARSPKRSNLSLLPVESDDDDYRSLSSEPIELKAVPRAKVGSRK